MHGGIQRIASVSQSFSSSSQQAFDVETVGVFLPRHLGKDEFVVIIAQSASHLVVVHVGAVLPLAPATGDLFRIQHPEFSARSLPADTRAVVLRVCQHLQKELPQLDLAGSWRQRNI